MQNELDTSKLRVRIRKQNIKEVVWGFLRLRANAGEGNGTVSESSFGSLATSVGSSSSCDPKQQSLRVLHISYKIFKERDFYFLFFKNEDKLWDPHHIEL